MRVLLLDPCNDLQESLQRYLELSGHQVKVIDNTTSALSMCTVFNEQLLVSEYISDDPDYVKLFKQIHTISPSTKIVILTCNLLSVDEVAALTDIGINCVYQKPLDPEIIKNTIDLFEKKPNLVSHITKQILISNPFTNHPT